jgi:succinate-acetate transporter protein
MLSGFTLFALVTLRLQQQRRRKVADVTMDFWRFGLSCLLLALLMLALANAAQISIGDTDLVVGALLIVGFAMSLITGMLYKIIPFLVWLHLTNTIDISARWQMRIPNMKKIVPDKHARNQWRLHLLAVCLIMLSLMISSLMISSLVFAASAAFMLSNLYLAFNLIRGAAVYQRFVRQFNLAETD